MSNDKILVATDFSIHATAAIERAAQVAAQTGSSLHLLHIVKLSLYHDFLEFIGSDRTGVLKGLRDSALTQLTKAADDIKKRHTIDVTSEVREGRVTDEILDCARAHNAQLIVAGAHGVTEKKEKIIGSTVDRIIRNSTYNLLVVHAMPSKTYQHALIPVDFSGYSLPAIKLTASLLPKAELRLFHAFESLYEGKLRTAGVDNDVISDYVKHARHEAAQNMELLIEETGLEKNRLISRTIEHGSAQLTINDYINKHNIDLVVMGRHGRSHLEKLFLGSTTRHILSESSCDVLVCNLEKH
ncbi:MAG TPA: universal stress protein [Gammaproteobacteria bacterium]